MQSESIKILLPISNLWKSKFQLSNKNHISLNGWMIKYQNLKAQVELISKSIHVIIMIDINRFRQIKIQCLKDIRYEAMQITH